MKAVSTIRPGVGHQPRDLADAADVLDPVGLGEAEVAVEAVADIVAVEQEGVPPARASFFSTRLAMVDLPAPDRPVNHSTAGFWPLMRGVGLAADVEMLAMDVERAPKREMQHSARDRGVGQLVDQDEAAERLVRARALDRIRLEHDLAVGRDLGDADGVEAERRRGEMLERVDVDLVLRAAGPSP